MSATAFTSFNFDNNINKAILQCGYTEATPIQAKAIPVILEGKDVIATAQTGTGKTAAFVLPILEQLAKNKMDEPGILILSPTRELALQITKAAMQYGKFMRFNIVNLVGGMPYPQQIRELNRGADIIIATPGRLIDHIESNRVNLSAIQTLILDEADRMLDMGFIEDVQYVAALTPKSRQTLLFSATFDKRLATEVKDLLKSPVRIDLSEKNITAPKIAQTMYRTSSMHQKTRLLKQFLTEDQIYKAIIFSATKMHADKLAEELRADGFAAAALHGDLRQNVRKRTVEQLRNGKVQFLIATDVAARGLDINDVTHVFNYDLPKFCEDYVHRIGRTGRAGKTGIAISFVSPADFKLVQRIERYIGQPIKMVKDVTIKYTASEKEPFDVESLNERGDSSRGRGGRGEGRGGRPSGLSGKRDGRRSEGRSEFRSDRPERAARSEFRGDRPERSTRGESRGDRSERPARPEFRSERPERGGYGKPRGDRPERGAPRSEFRGERTERRAKPEARSERAERGQKIEYRERTPRSGGESRARSGARPAKPGARSGAPRRGASEGKKAWSSDSRPKKARRSREG